MTQKITVYFEVAERVRDIRWDLLSGKTLYGTPFWDDELILVSAVHTYEQLGEFCEVISWAIEDGADWEEHDVGEMIYEFDLPDGRVLRLVSLYA